MRKLLIPLGSCAMLLLASPAAANTVNSANWAGYAVHRSGVSFSKVVGAWTAPKPTCTPGHQSYSAVWVGLGGYSLSSQALEQIGTEADCDGAGHVVSDAWYEQVPQPSRTVRLTVRPGDALFASVTVVGNRVRLVLTDRTRHRSFVKTLIASLVDVSSAEWIVEAPSECADINTCQTLPLANFGSTRIKQAYAQSNVGRFGTISNPGWDDTRIRLTPSGHQFVLLGGHQSMGGAVPSGLASRGSSFVVKYARQARAASAASAAGDVRGGHLFHPGRW